MSHFSELRVDKLLADELDRDAAMALRAHAAACTRCGEVLAEATATREAFEFRPIGSRHRAWWRSSAVVVPIAMTAAVVLLLAWPARPSKDRVRTKGSSSLGWFVKHGLDVRRGLVHELVMPGDRLEFSTSATAPGWFAALAEDAGGVRSVYVPLQPIAPGRDRLAAGAIELDDTLGRETVTGVFCDHRFEPTTIDLVVVPPGCTTDRLTLDKVAR